MTKSVQVSSADNEFGSSQSLPGGREALDAPLPPLPTVGAHPANSALAPAGRVVSLSGRWLKTPN